MFENIAKFFKKLMKSEAKEVPSKETAKERLHLVLMQDRANVSADFLELMKQEIIEVIKKYIEVEEAAIDVRLTNEVEEDGSQGAPSLYANIPILKIKNEAKKENSNNLEETKQETEKEPEKKASKGKSKKTDKEDEEKKETEAKAKEEVSKVEKSEVEDKASSKDEQEKPENNEEQEKQEVEESKKSESQENKEPEPKEDEEKEEIEE